MKAHGTTPLAAANEEQASRWVRDMFGEVAPRYDFLNHLLSLNLDKTWRARTVERLKPVLSKPGVEAIDLCCGTCDLLQTIEAATPARAYGTDFCRPMLTAAQRKRLRSPLLEADALNLPVRDAAVDVATCAFGFRNLANYQKGLDEMLRILKPGGTAAILEFSTPPNAAFGSLYRFYSRRILPRVGEMLSGSKTAYQYLPESVRKFPAAEELADQMRGAGFEEVRFERMTFGIVALHLGVRPR